MRFRMFSFSFCAAIVFAVIHCSFPSRLSADRPNVIVIMSDDQGVGDYGFMGNDIIRTPSLDALHAKSGYLSNFYVSNVCAPTRASLMTGRYNYRTRCIDTYVGRAMMDPDEVTLAEYLGDGGYQTGIFGKWHLGDNYPMRPMDQGFQVSLIHRGGGIGQPSDPIGAEGNYTDPILFRNGQQVQMQGYCTDLFFDAAIDFVSGSVSKDEPFFAYIATNAPHGPFHDVPTELYEEYKQVDFKPIVVGNRRPKQLEAEQDRLARIAAMITNIDDNVGKLMDKLNQLGIADNTIVIYLNDNGPNTMRYVGNMRGMKTHMDDGGIRSPLVFHWPAKVKANATSSEMCAHLDLLPTLLEACGVDASGENKIDGRSFLPLLTEAKADWPTRQLVFQSHRGNQPQPFHHFALHEGPWKLVHPSGFGKERFEGAAKLELYDLKADPQQRKDLAAAHPEVVARLAKAYEDWFADVSSTRPNNYAPPNIVVGTTHEPTTVLTRQDWRHVSGRPWAKDSTGFWLLENAAEREFEVEVILPDAETEGRSARLDFGTKTETVPLMAGRRAGHRVTVRFPAGEFSLKASIVEGDKVIGGAHQVVLSAK